MQFLLPLLQFTIFFLELQLMMMLDGQAAMNSLREKFNAFDNGLTRDQFVDIMLKALPPVEDQGVFAISCCIDKAITRSLRC